MSSSNSTVSLTLQIHGQQATQQIQRLNLNITSGSAAAKAI
jgi:ABC-type transporter lipoprotein component MlaA